MRRLSRVHFMTSYVEYLLRLGIRNEDDYIGDVSRFLRYLLTQVDNGDIEAFFAACNACRQVTGGGCAARCAGFSTTAENIWTSTCAQLRDFEPQV